MTEASAIRATKRMQSDRAGPMQFSRRFSLECGEWQRKGRKGRGGETSYRRRPTRQTNTVNVTQGLNNSKRKQQRLFYRNSQEARMTTLETMPANRMRTEKKALLRCVVVAGGWDCQGVYGVPHRYGRTAVEVQVRDAQFRVSKRNKKRARSGDACTSI